MILISNEDNEYELIVDKDPEQLIGKIELNAANVFNEHWSDRGVEEVKNKLLDDGQGVKVNLQGKNIDLNYSEMEHLYLLIRVWKDKFEHGSDNNYKYLEITEMKELP